FPQPVVGPVLSDSTTRAAANTGTMTRLCRLAALIAWAEALARQSYASRPDGVAARAAAAERLDLELMQLGGAENYWLYVAIQNLRGSVVTYLTQLIADLAPVVTVTANQSMPALWWAWRLYHDPTRTVDLVQRNEVRHPSFMPTEFVALA